MLHLLYLWQMQAEPGPTLRIRLRRATSAVKALILMPQVLLEIQLAIHLKILLDLQ